MATYIPYLMKYSAKVKPSFYDELVVVLRVCTPRMQICFVDPIPSFDLLHSLRFHPVILQYTLSYLVGSSPGWQVPNFQQVIPWCTRKCCNYRIISISIEKSSTKAECCPTNHPPSRANWQIDPSDFARPHRSRPRSHRWCRFA